jgi:D-3-phosphoglycerate dehydrogenase / 2-oxoglutarate reductase
LQGHPLLRLENTLCTPHIGFVEKNSYEMYFSAAFEAINAFAAGTPERVVNPDALKVRRKK